MKKILLLTAAIIGGIALPTLLMAGPTENITGCATAPVEGANYTVRVDPTCALATETTSNGFYLTSVDDDDDSSTPNVPAIGVPGVGAFPIN